MKCEHQGCREEATHRLHVHVKDAPSRPKWHHDYCETHAWTAETTIFMCAAATNRIGIVESKVTKLEEAS